MPLKQLWMQRQFGDRHAATDDGTCQLIGQLQHSTFDTQQNHSALPTVRQQCQHASPSLHKRVHSESTHGRVALSGRSVPCSGDQVKTHRVHHIENKVHQPNSLDGRAKCCCLCGFRILAIILGLERPIVHCQHACQARSAFVQQQLAHSTGNR